MNKSTYITNSPEATKKLAFDFAKKMTRGPSSGQNSIVVALSGELGSGKTAFVQGLAKGLGIKEKVNSPTFNILKIYKNFYHFDCYRIEKIGEILDLGFGKNILLEFRN